MENFSKFRYEEFLIFCLNNFSKILLRFSITSAPLFITLPIATRLSQTAERIEREVENCLADQKEIQIRIAEAELRLEVAMVEKSQFDHLLGDIDEFDEHEKNHDDKLG